MAKLKGPLFSFGAAGAIGKTLVYFGWKGLDVVREYVIPANPQTTPQTTQRGYLTDAVAATHTAQAHETKPLSEGDSTAYALLGSTYPTPRTWFNSIVKQWLDQKVATKIPVIYRWGFIYPGDTLLRVTMQLDEESSLITDGKLYYGTSRTALINSVDCTRAEILAEKEITGLVNGTKYFVQYRPDTPTTFAGSNSGIYYGKPHA